MQKCVSSLTEANLFFIDSLGKILLFFFNFFLINKFKTNTTGVSKVILPCHKALLSDLCVPRSDSFLMNQEKRRSFLILTILPTKSVKP